MQRLFDVSYTVPSSDIDPCLRRHCVPKAAQQQHIHGGATQRREPGHAVSVDQIEQRNLGSRRAQDTARQ